MSAYKDKVKLDWEQPECSTDGCTRKRSMIDQHCRYHQILKDARWLTAAELDSLRAELANVVVLTADERTARHQASALSWLSSQSRSLEHSRQSAIECGATDEQVTAAIADGAARNRKGVL